MARIAMWSGPRNLSTAMMYAFAARGDCAVWDEPFYGAYLMASASAHPLHDDIVAGHEVDPIAVAAECADPVPDGKAHLYMKHMPHHMLPEFPLGWAEGCVNVHLIRHPARVIASYAEKRSEITLEDIGYPQQAAIWRRFPGPVIDSVDIRQDPATALARLCADIGVAWTDKMLSWPAGPKSFDGAWAPHWYNAVHSSTGFAGPEGALPEVPAAHQALLQEALPLYEAMKSAAIGL